MPDNSLQILKRGESGDWPVSGMIQKVRVDHACRMLSDTKRTISDISHSCGFDDIKFFYKVFKKQIGVLPGEYREQKKQSPPG